MVILLLYNFSWVLKRMWRNISHLDCEVKIISHLDCGVLFHTKTTYMILFTGCDRTRDFRDLCSLILCLRCNIQCKKNEENLHTHKVPRLVNNLLRWHLITKKKKKEKSTIYVIMIMETETETETETDAIFYSCLVVFTVIFVNSLNAHLGTSLYSKHPQTSIYLFSLKLKLTQWIVNTI